MHRSFWSRFLFVQECKRGLRQFVTTANKRWINDRRRTDKPIVLMSDFIETVERHEEYHLPFTRLWDVIDQEDKIRNRPYRIDIDLVCRVEERHIDDLITFGKTPRISGVCWR